MDHLITATDEAILDQEVLENVRVLSGESVKLFLDASVLFPYDFLEQQRAAGRFIAGRRE